MGLSFFIEQKTMITTKYLNGENKKPNSQFNDLFQVLNFAGYTKR